MRAGPRQPSDLEAAFAHYWRVLKPHDAPDPVREYPAIEGRRFRFDYAWPDHRVAVELHGGTWQQGRHTRGQGFANDREKVNLAQLDGWTVIELTADMLSGNPARWIAAIADVVRGVR